MPAPKKPQDHKGKAEKPSGFTFEHNGETFLIPPPSNALAALPGKVYRDAVMEGPAGETRLSFTALELVVTHLPTLDALYAKPAPEMIEIVQAWFQSAADESGATGPQS